MSTLFVALVIISLIGLLLFFLWQVEKKKKARAMHELFLRFSRLGSLLGLSFSSQEVLSHVVIGLDGCRRQLLVINNGEGLQSSFTLIDLKEVKTCFLRKTFISQPATGLKNRKGQDYLKQIILRFEWRVAKEAVEIAFFDRGVNSIYELKSMEEKARQWEAIISKLSMPEKKRA